MAIVEAKTQEAIGFVNEAIELLPKEVDSDRRRRWQIQELSYRAFMHRAKAEAARDVKNFPVAMQQFQTCSENHQKAGELYRQLGMENDAWRAEGRSHTALRDFCDVKATQAYDAGSEQYASYLEEAIKHAHEAVRFRIDWEWWREERDRLEEKYRAFHEQQVLRRQFEALGEVNSQLRKQIAGLERKIVRERLRGLLAGFILGVLASLVAGIILSLLGIV